MPLNPGTTLGSYSVTAKIGEGGMGEVYRARDTKLDRDVALKVLPQAFTDDPDRLARFEREAKVLASLNHPNIGGIYGLEESDGVRALVLEYIDGPTLADRIAQGPIPLDEALPIAKQIAEALEAAHEQGVIHRDLKPANIKLRSDGTVKVLDFGLAKALDAAPEGDPSQSPTLTAAATQMGVIMGTAAYMSPEQARGKPVDKRADIWAFGAVLFEMLAGRRPFVGNDVSTTLAKVLEKEPTWDELPDGVPATLANVVKGCLHKEARQRLRDIGDVRLALEGAFETVPETPRSGASRLLTPYLAGALMLVAGVAVGRIMWTPDEPTGIAPVRRLSITLGDFPSFLGGTGGWAGMSGMALAPDGTRVVYVAEVDGQRQLAVRTVDQLGVQLLPGTEGALFPFFSPHSDWVGFFASDGTPRTRTALSLAAQTPVWTLKTMMVDGGAPVTLAEGVPALGATWGDDDAIIIGGDGLQRVAAAGGPLERLTDLLEDEGAQAAPSFLPGSKSLLFTAWYGLDQRSRKTHLLSLESGERRFLIDGSAIATPSRHIVVGQAQDADGLQDTIMAASFDVGRSELVGFFVPLQGDVSGGFSVSRDGTLVHARPVGDLAESMAQRTLVWVDRTGHEEPLDAPARPYSSPRLTPDGTQLVVVVGDGEDSDLWLHDLARGRQSQLTFSPFTDSAPVWHPDGERIAFWSTRESPGAPFLRAADGTGSDELLFSDPNRMIWPWSWSPSGETLVLLEFAMAGGTSNDISALSMNGERVRTPLLPTPDREALPETSPDGRWLAYLSNATGQDEVVVVPFPEVLGGR